jgi:hypothetical protein
MRFGWLGIGVTLLWVGTMWALVSRDVLPAWRAKPIPPIATRKLVENTGENHQAGIFDPNGRRIGTSWTVYMSMVDIIINSTTYFEAVPMLGNAPILVDSSARMNNKDVLDKFELDLYGPPPMRIQLQGENYDPDFPCSLKIGTIDYQFNLDANMVGMMSDILRPFIALPELKVGASWTMELFDPWTAIIQKKAEVKPVLVRVTGKEDIKLDAGPVVSCFVIETNNAKAWADVNGRVLVQEVDVPIFGQLTIRDEPYDRLSRQEARQRMRRP